MAKVDVNALPVKASVVPNVPLIDLPEPGGMGSPPFTYSMSLLRVDIDRPWLEMETFHNHTWKIDGVTAKGAGLTVHSGAAEPDMPLIITGLLLARKAKLTLDYKTQLEAELRRKMRSLGPFSLFGKLLFGRGTPQAQSEIRALAAGRYETVVSFDGAQIIGFFCERVPKSPDPDPKYTYP